MIGSEQLKEFECPICLEYCRDAVESECCGHAFCHECTVNFTQKNQSCPYCRAPKLIVRESKILRRVISEIKSDCPNKGCEEKIACKDLEKHKNRCPFKSAKCRHCSIQILLGKVAEHILADHRQQAMKILTESHVEQSEIKLSKISSVNQSAIKSVFDPTESVKNRSGKMSSLGNNGKYYCNGKLGVACKCCDGNCGPTNGENCVDCMRLDKEVRGLGKGYLVNSQGRIARVTQGHAVCGVYGMISMMGNRCIKSSQCKSCKNMTLARYAQLL